MRCEYCKRFLDDLDEEDIIGRACRECYEEKEDLLTFKTMLNYGVQRLNLDKYDVIRMLDNI